jgi:Fe-S-cluster containining protein
MNVNAKNVATLAQRKRDENFDFRAYLKMQEELSEEEIDQLVADTAAGVRALFDCSTCANCCKEIGTQVTQPEIRGLADALLLTEDEFRAKYLDSQVDPADVDEGGVAQWLIRGEPCPFLKDNRCSVYEVRPAQCRGYPYLDWPEFSCRTLGMIERTYTCPIVYQLFEELKAQLPFRRRRSL